MPKHSLQVVQMCTIVVVINASVGRAGAVSPYSQLSCRKMHCRTSNGYDKKGANRDFARIRGLITTERVYNVSGSAE
jgi:hypothetical protein